MTNNFRYIVRKEFFGALVYDRATDSYLALDEELYNILQKSPSEIMADKELFNMLLEEDFFVNDQRNYICFSNTHLDDTLSSPARIHFYYTTACNLNCKHCFTKKHNVGEEMTFEEKCNLIDQMSDLGIAEILVGGGEPFVKNDFVDFVNYSISKGIATKVFTNGLLLNDELCNKISNWDITYMSISVDGTTEDEYESIRGIRGLEIVKENIRRVKRTCKFPLAISITVNNNNYMNAEQYLELALNCDVDRIKVRPTKPSGNIFDHPEVYLTPERYLEFITNMQRIWNAKYKDKFRLDFSWGDSRLLYNPESDSIEVADIVFPYDGYGCFAGKGSMVISANGMVSPCGFLPVQMQFNSSDNIKEKKIKDIWDNGTKFNRLRQLTGNQKCLACKYYPVCRGGCIARIIYAGKKITDVDPWCLDKFFPVKIGV